MEILIVMTLLALLLLAIGVWARRQVQAMDATCEALKEQIEQADDVLSAIKAELARQQRRYFVQPVAWQAWECDERVETVIVESLS